MSHLAPLARFALALALAACSQPAPAPDATLPLDASHDALAPEAPAPDAAPDACVPSAVTPGTAFGNGLALPDWTLSDAHGGAVRPWSLREPCATQPRLLVVRTLAAWSGPSQWAASHTAMLRALPGGERLWALDLLVLGQDNLPAVTADLDAFAPRYDAAPEALVADPAYSVQGAFIGGAQLPVIALVDTRTMLVTELLLGASWNDVTWAVARALARMDGLPRPARPTPTYIDGRFATDQWQLLQRMSPLTPPPADPTNRVADSPAAAALGAQLFTDENLSPEGTSCARCHDPAQGFADGRATGLGAAPLDRNTPSMQFSAWQRWQFWDGRADSQWSQALGPLENAREMHGSRLRVAHRLASQYVSAYAAVFGPSPSLADVASLPAAGAPGDVAWEALTPAQRQLVNTVFANAGKALAAYERSLARVATPFDRYVAGDFTALSPQARDGIAHFFEAGCAQCHHGPTLSDDSFHNIQMPTGRQDGAPDRGRIDALALVLASPFNGSGTSSDLGSAAPWLAALASAPEQLGQFHTPPLRGTAQTGPWGHGGTFATLRSVMLHYSQRQLIPSVAGSIGTQDRHLPSFDMTDDYLGALVAFMNALSP